MTAALSVSSQPASTAHASRAGEGKTSNYDDGLSAFMSVRPRLFGIAYRILGSAAEAEDVVQDAWVRWQTADRSQVRDAAAFLATTATRLAINVCSRHTRAERRAPDPGCRNRSIPVPTLAQEWNDARHWRVGFCCCWKS